MKLNLTLIAVINPDNDHEIFWGIIDLNDCFGYNLRDVYEKFAFPHDHYIDIRRINYKGCTILALVDHTSVPIEKFYGHLKYSKITDKNFPMKTIPFPTPWIIPDSEDIFITTGSRYFSIYISEVKIGNSDYMKICMVWSEVWPICHIQD